MPTSDKPDNTTEKYYPPTHDVLVHFAESIGNQMGEGFDDFEVVHGLADFMSVIAHTLANNLNRKHRSEFDNGVE
jgi:hypothetical protein